MYFFTELSWLSFPSFVSTSTLLSSSGSSSSFHESLLWFSPLAFHSPCWKFSSLPIIPEPIILVLPSGSYTHLVSAHMSGPSGPNQ